MNDNQQRDEPAEEPLALPQEAALLDGERTDGECWQCKLKRGGPLTYQDHYKFFLITAVVAGILIYLTWDWPIIGKLILPSLGGVILTIKLFDSIHVEITPARTRVSFTGRLLPQTWEIETRRLVDFEILEHVLKLDNADVSDSRYWEVIAVYKTAAGTDAPQHLNLIFHERPGAEKVQARLHAVLLQTRAVGRVALVW